MPVLGGRGTAEISNQLNSQIPSIEPLNAVSRNVTVYRDVNTTLKKGVTVIININVGSFITRYFYEADLVMKQKQTPWL
jgi:hypothetical protein